MKTQGSAVWNGGIRDRKGAISTHSGALSGYPCGFASRFEGKAGSNPEELIGAAHAACFTMALALARSHEGLIAESLTTTAEITLDKDGDGYAITPSRLTLKANIPGLDEAKFQDIATKAKAACPVSKLLKAEITLDAQLAHPKPRDPDLSPALTPGLGAGRRHGGRGILGPGVAWIAPAHVLAHVGPSSCPKTRQVARDLDLAVSRRKQRQR